jgi:hypothetical protein
MKDSPFVSVLKSMRKGISPKKDKPDIGARMSKLVMALKKKKKKKEDK